MDIVVCIKQVPDVNAPFRIRRGELIFDTNRAMLNAYDASAMEAALVLTGKHGGTVRVVTVGSERASETLRKALAMGADAADQLVVPEGADLDARAYAEGLARHFAETETDAIFCGKQSQDTDAGLTGPMLATLLDWPYATNAVGLEIDESAGAIVVECQGEQGTKVIELPTPCLVTCSNDMNDPRIPNLKGIMQAKRKPIETRDVSDWAQRVEPMTTVVGFEPMPEREPGTMLDGEPTEMVRTLVDRLDDDGVL